ncbi:MAG: beta-galactosidase, partial [Bacteroidales bacterium]|nr:beta-galactosidase [Bacteroidales bacterium]
MKTKHFIVSFLVVLCHISALQAAPQRSRYNFNHDWLLYVGDQAEAKQIKFNDSQWKAVNLPAAFNEDQAFAKDIKDLDNQVVWYRKHFKVPATHKKQKIFIEFEGARQGAEIWINEQF